MNNAYIFYYSINGKRYAGACRSLQQALGNWINAEERGHMLGISIQFPNGKEYRLNELLNMIEEKVNEPVSN